MYRLLSRRLDRCDRVIQNESRDPNGGNVCLFSASTCRPYVTTECKLWTLPKADEKRIESAELWINEPVGLRAPYRPKYFDRIEYHQTARGLPGFVVRHNRPCFGHTIRDGGCELVKCVIQREVHGKRRCGRPKSNMTSHSGNIKKWMGGNVKGIMRDSRDCSIDGEHWCEVLHGRLHLHFLTGPRKKKKKSELKS